MYIVRYMQKVVGTFETYNEALSFVITFGMARRANTRQIHIVKANS